MSRAVPRRRALGLAAVGALGLPVAGFLGWRLWCRCAPAPPPDLLCEGAVTGADGVTRPVPPGRSAPTSAPGPAPPAADRRPAPTIPPGPWRETALAALADLRTMTGPLLAPIAGPSRPSPFPVGAVVAAPVSYWRYVWPRDASFAAAACSAAGLAPEALAVLRHLSSLQRPDGGFEARYTYAGTVPDSRPMQVDGAGWVLWATARLAADLRAAGAGPADVADRLAALGPMVARATSHLTRLTAVPSHLPPVGPDYWELDEDALTMGLALPVLVGLEAAEVLVGLGVGEPAVDREHLARRTAQVRDAVVEAFAPTWGRHAGADDVDAMIALALPPFTSALPGALAVRRGARARMARSCGGVAPGSAWRDDGVSWTPETALLAWSALALGAGDAALAREGVELMDWLTAHRTALGCLPEKVRADGAPAGPAPLAWTCALVVLAACQPRG